MPKQTKAGVLSPPELTVMPRCETASFENSDELERFTEVFGHERAFKALEFGLSMERCGYNIFISGMPGSGRLALTTEYVRKKAKQGRPVYDSLYVANFDDPKSPIALQVDCGLGSQLVGAIEHLISNLVSGFSSSIESPAYQREKATIDAAFNERYSALLSELSSQAKALNVFLDKDGETISFAPLLGDTPATEEEFSSFPDEDKEAFSNNVRFLEAAVLDRLMVVPHWRRESREQLANLLSNTIRGVLHPLMEGLSASFPKHAGLTSFYDTLFTYLLHALTDEQSSDRSADIIDESSRKSRLLRDCVPRLLVSSNPVEGRPVVVESNPTLRNLFGYAESNTEQGSVVTRHSLIYPGSIHKANGGYLILEADKIISESQVWPALKRALKNQSLRIETTSQDASLATPVSLNPQELALNLKVILVGSSDLFYLLQELDAEFIELFRVLCDFDDDFPRSVENELKLIRLVATLAQHQGLPPFSRNAASILLQYSSRLADDRERLSAHIGDLLELVVEANYHRNLAADNLIDRIHVESAITDRKHRSSRLSESVMQEIIDGTILIDTGGASVGRVNGLTVIDIGGYQFGNPARISATVFPGSRGVVDIEREVELGEAIHSKGVMILTGYLGQRYARDMKMAFSANLALEQSYGHVDGDSASLAELCALISALADLPVKQGLAVTGSINQYGEVQPVGGVNEKIEGFFELCRSRGLNGKQGVVIPHINKRHLVLNDDVVKAVAEGKFYVWTVTSVDEALSLLTGKGTRHIDKRVITRLKALSEVSEHSEL